jgi:AcrR family transcriptional regulator
MDDISKELGISKKTLYQMVKDKAELIDIVMQNRYNEFKNQVLQIFDKSYDPVLQLIKLNNEVLEHLKKFSPTEEYDLRKYYSDIFQKLKIHHIELMSTCINQNIIEGKKMGLYRADIDTEILTKLHVARIEQAPHTEIYSLEEYTSPGFAREVCFAHLKSLVSEKGQQLVDKHMNELKDKNI